MTSATQQDIGQNVRQWYNKPRFRVSYAGSADYEVAPGVVVRVRAFGNPDFAWNTGVWKREIRPAVGVVMFDSPQLFHGFPPPEVVAMFPGYVGGRWNADISELQTTEPARQVTGPSGVVFAKAYADNLAEYGLSIW